jgi:RNA polymerase sigma-70 factor (ECF subfamily)
MAGWTARSALKGAVSGAPRHAGSSDAELLQLVAESKVDAFEAIWERYGGAVYAACLRRLREPGAAEDATQEAFTTVWRRARTFDAARGSAAAWLFAVARNAASQQARGARREALMAVLPEAGEAQEADIIRYLEVQAALTRLPETERAVLELAYFDDLSQTQIAQRLRLPLGTVKSRTRAGLQRLAQWLEADRA